MSKKSKPNYVPAPGKAVGYRYQDKDPILYFVLHLIEESGLSDAEIARRSGVTPTTLNRWRYENVRKPQFPTLRAVLQAINIEFAGVNSEGKVIKISDIFAFVASDPRWMQKWSEPPRKPGRPRKRV